MTRLNPAKQDKNKTGCTGENETIKKHDGEMDRRVFFLCNAMVERNVGNRNVGEREENG